MNRVKRAIIMAAGEGRRLRPLTDRTHKALLPVNGRPMIHTILDALETNGIRDVTVVVGYKKEQFASLPERWPGVRLVENPWYADRNNIFSLYAARDYLPGAMVLDGDQVIYDPAALDPAFERSGYNCVWTDEPTGEWLLTLDGEGVVRSCSRTGGVHGWRLYSVSRWSEADGARLADDLERAVREEKNWSLYWDDVALFLHPEAYRLGVWPMAADAVTEIDSLAELAAIDSGYAGYIASKEGKQR